MALQQDPTDLTYEVRRSDRARRASVKVHPDGRVEVVLPRRAPERQAAEVVRELRGWIDGRLRALDRARSEREASRPTGTVPYLGRDLELVPEPSRRIARRHGDRLHVPADPTAQRAALERWYRRRAHEEVAPRLDAATARAGTRYTRLTVREQRTRWASCSSTGAMSFNWRLLLAPEAVLDYVVEHEVCHLEVLDHSPRFWALLESRCPDWRVHARWLKRYGSTLVL